MLKVDVRKCLESGHDIQLRLLVVVVDASEEREGGLMPGQHRHLL